jgi:gentisate 1,2-dioxygenase
VPSWCKVAHQATDDAVLFSFSDRPVQKALDLWRAEAPMASHANGTNRLHNNRL